MKIAALLEQLKTLDIRLKVADGKLLVDAPKHAMVDSIRTSIQKYRDELIQLLGDQYLSPPQLLPQPREKVTTVFPLSISQHAFFMLDRLSPQSRAFNIFSVRELTGSLDISRLANAWGQVVAKHDSLRTAIVWHDDGAQQVVHSQVSAPLHVIDLSDVGADQASKSSAQLSSRQSAPRFILDQGQLFNLKLIREHSEQHILVMALHHIIADDRSVDLLYKDLVQTYATGTTKQQVQPEALQYPDYAAWERQQLTDGAFDSSIDYWRKQLMDMPTLLPAQLQQPMLSESQSDTIHASLDEHTSRMVWQLASATESSRFAVVLSVFQLLWCLRTGDVDIPVIVPTSGRDMPVTRGMVGLFVNSVVMRINLQGYSSIAELVKTNTRISNEVQGHRRISLEALDGILRLRGEHDIKLDSLSRVGFNYLVAEEGQHALALGDLSIKARPVDRSESVFSLLLIVQEHAGKLRVKLEYRKDVWAEETAQQFIDQFVQVLSSFCHPRNDRLAQVSAVSEQALIHYAGSLPNNPSVVSRLPKHWRQYLNGYADEMAVPCFYWSLPLMGHIDSNGLYQELLSVLIDANEQLPHYFAVDIPGGDQRYIRQSDNKTSSEYWPVQVGCEFIQDTEHLNDAVALASQEISHSVSSLGCLLVSGDRWVLVASALPGSMSWQHWLSKLVSGCPALFECLTQTTHQTHELQPAICPEQSISELHLDNQSFDNVNDYCQQQNIDMVDFVTSVVALSLSRVTGQQYEVMTWLMEGVANNLRRPRCYPITDPSQTFSSWLEQSNELEFDWMDQCGHCSGDRWQLIVHIDNNEQSLPCGWLTNNWQAHLQVAQTEQSLWLQCHLPARLSNHPFLLQQVSEVITQIIHTNASLDDLHWFSHKDAEVLKQLNETSNNHILQDGSVLSLFEQQVSARAKHPAVVCADQSISFTELDQASRVYADWLLKQTEGEQQVVAVCLDRDIELIPVLLGILRAGCAFVPIDSNLPASRVNHMLQTSEASLLLVSACFEPEWTTFSETYQVHMMVVPGMTVDKPISNDQQMTVEPDQLAYIIFTSGSSGQPKGVRVAHGMLSNLLQSMLDRPGVDQHDGMLAMTHISFDIALLEWLLPLIAGATVCLTHKAIAQDPAHIIQWLNDESVTIAQATPSTWRLLLDCGWQGRSGLRVLCGGESLDYSLSTDLLARVDEVWNVYGPTETTIWSTIFPVQYAGRASVIGRPIANTLVRIEDDMNRPVGVGEVGELVIGGAGVALGYCGASNDVEDAFYTDHFIGENGVVETQRFYRTGDRVLLNRDGQLVFVGRLDRQIKWRGVRIELNEIEAVLNLLPEIVESAVWVHSDDDQQCITAAVVMTEHSRLTISDIKTLLSHKLPTVMLPEQWVVTDRLPRLVSGKLDRSEVPSLIDSVSTEQSVLKSGDADQLEAQLMQIWSELLGHKNFTSQDNFFDSGGHSMLLIAAHQRIVAELGVELEPIDLFTHTSITALTQFLYDQNSISVDEPKSFEKTKTVISAQEPIAVIGLAGRFPEANDAKTFWQNLCIGKEAIQDIDSHLLVEQGVPAGLLCDANYVRRASYIEDIEQFDADFFGLSAREAELMDPQHRLLLELAYQSLEDAGYDYRSMSEVVGIHAGVGLSSYLIYHLWPNRNEILSTASPLEMLYANDKDYAITRTAYLLNLRGPSVSLGTACSTGLVAVHQACASLRLGECEMALAGAVKIGVPQQAGYIFKEGGIMSPDGHCRPFDNDAAGTVFGSGGGCVLLKPLSAAKRDGDDIYAVIRGSAVNNDGHDKLGFTAPSVSGQAAVIETALENAQVNADQINYVEAHGTGTRLGDPVEILALQQTYARFDMPDVPCVLGSVKANIGHLDTAAGMAGLVKVILSLQQGELAPSINFDHLNDQIKWDAKRFQVKTERAPWPSDPGQRYAGVSSFGIGGGNAHMVLQDYLAEPVSADQVGAELIVLSAETESALEQRRIALLNDLIDNPEKALSDVAYTLRVGRPAMRYRISWVVDSVATLMTNLQQTIQPSVTNNRSTEVTSLQQRLVFLFPGQGLNVTEQVNDLYQQWLVYQQAFDQCAAFVAQYSDWDLHQLIRVDSTESQDLFERTDIVQLVLFTTQYCLTKLLISLGIKPTVLLGHSLGEITAACIAGVFSLEQAVRLVVIRGASMQAAAEGAMLAVFAAVDKVNEILEQCSPQAEVAAYNGEKIIIISGSHAAIDTAQAGFTQASIKSQLLPTNRAFHSNDMCTSSQLIGESLNDWPLQKPKISLLCNVDGKWANEQVAKADYWSRQVRRPVKFWQCLQSLQVTENDSVIEIDLNANLTQLLLAYQPELASVILSHNRLKCQAGVNERFLTILGYAWQRGNTIDWSVFKAAEPNAPRRLHLPVYTFTKQRYWIDRPDQLGQSPDTSRRNPVDRWVYQPSWVREHITPAPLLAGSLQNQHWLLFVSDQETLVEREMVQYLLESDCHVIVLKACAAIAKELQPITLVVDAGDLDQLHMVCAGLVQAESTNYSVVYGWSLDLLEQADEFTVATAICQLSKVSTALSSVEAKLRVLTQNNQAVTTSHRVHLMPSVFNGALKVLRSEYAKLNCRLVDIESAMIQTESIARILLQECLCSHVIQSVAIRNEGGRHERWVEAYSRYRVQAPLTRIDTDQVYVITGGLGGIGALLAEHLMTTRGCQVALIGRTPLDVSPISKSPRQQRYQRLCERQPGLPYYAIDVSDSSALQKAMDSVVNQLGPIGGIIHAAGCADGRMAGLHTTSSVADIIRPKLYGTLAVMQAAVERAVPEVILFSSITSVTGDIGQLAYAAANSFMDGLVEQFNHSEVRCVSINWDTWREVGMAAESDMNGVAGDALDQLRARGLSNSEALELFDRLSHQHQGRFIVSTVDLDDRVHTRVDITVSQPTSKKYQRPNLANDLVEAHDELEVELVKVWRTALRLEQVGVTDNYFELGGTSLQALQLVSEIESALSVRMSSSALLERPTIRELAIYLQDRQVWDKPVKLSNTLVKLADSTAERDLSLYLVHPIGGQVYLYRELAEQLSDTVQTYGVRADTQSTMADAPSVVAMASQYVEQILSQGTAPEWLGGSSFGGMVAYEMAQQLAAVGHAPQWLFMLDTPDANDVSGQYSTDIQLLHYLAAQMPEFSWLKMLLAESQPEAVLSLLNSDNHSESMGGLLMHLQVLKQHMRAMQAYVAKPYAHAVVYIKANHRRPGIDPINPESDWHSRVKQFKLETVEGDHISMHMPPHVEAVAAIIRQTMIGALAKSDIDWTKRSISF